MEGNAPPQAKAMKSNTIDCGDDTLQIILIPCPWCTLPQEEYVVENAVQKALEVATRLYSDDPATPPHLVIGSDTVVVHADKILEKPFDEPAAAAMLASLSGTRHRVISGVALVIPSPSSSSGKSLPVVAKSWCTTTYVQFAELTAGDISAYIATGEPFDKAGGYGIQSIGGLLVKGIEGDYQNVKGFPLYDFGEQLASIGMEHWCAYSEGAPSAAASVSS
jgi:septum formation protein